MLGIVATAVGWLAALQVAAFVLWHLYLFLRYRLPCSRPRSVSIAAERSQESREDDEHASECAPDRFLAAEPPFVSGWVPWLGVAIDYGKDAYAYLHNTRQRFGDVFTLLLAGKRMTFVLDPLNIPVIFKGCRQLDFAPISHEVGKRAFDHPDYAHMTAMDDELHRAIVAKAQGQPLALLTERMNQKVYEFLCARRMVSAPPPGASPPDCSQTETRAPWRYGDLFAFVNECVFSAGTETLFGDGFCTASDLTAWSHFTQLDGKFPFLVGGVPLAFLPNVQSALRSLDVLVRQRYANESDFITTRLRILDHYAAGDRLRCRLMIAVLWASQANSIPAIFWALAYILSHPEAQTAIREEYTRVATSSSASSSSSSSSSAQAVHTPVVRPSVWDEQGRLRMDHTMLRQLPLLDSAINEAMRLCSSSIVIRRVMENFELTLNETLDTPSKTLDTPSKTQDTPSLPSTCTHAPRPVIPRKYLLRRGDHVCIFPEINHRDPEIFENPTEYRFDRFFNHTQQQPQRTGVGVGGGGGVGGPVKFFKGGHEIKYALLPFGGGVSHCPGRLFALNEMRIVVLCFLFHLQAELVPSDFTEDTSAAAAALQSPSPAPHARVTLPVTDPSRVGLGILPPLTPLRFRFRERPRHSM